jgi:1-deoxy-D-xylulose-5-phosphate reductoisomerase
MVAHDTTMKIPIFNTLYFNTNKKIFSNKVDFKIFNNLDFKRVNSKRYPMIKLLDFLPNKDSLFETVIVTANDTLVECFLNKKIKFIDIQKILFNILKDDEFLRYRNIVPKKLNDILDLNKYVRLKLIKKVYKKVGNG